MIFCNRCKQQIHSDDLVEPDNESGDGIPYQSQWGNDLEFSMKVLIKTPGYEREHYHQWCFLYVLMERITDDLNLVIADARRDDRMGYKDGLKTIPLEAADG